MQVGRAITGLGLYSLDEALKTRQLPELQGFRRGRSAGKARGAAEVLGAGVSPRSGAFAGYAARFGGGEAGELSCKPPV